MSTENHGDFTIPEDLEANTDKIKEQIAIIKELQKNNKRNEKDEMNQQTAKIRKIEEAPTTSKSSEPSTSSSALPSTTHAKIDNNLRDFFKERAAKFKAKDPAEMQAPESSAPPKPQQPKQSSMSELLQKERTNEPSSVQRGRMAEKLKNAAPYNYFLATITDSPRTHTDPLSVTFSELLDHSLGELESSVQFNCVVDINWLMAQYTIANVQHLPLLILYGHDNEELPNINMRIPNVTAVKVTVPFQYGVHHTKMMFMFYKDRSMRVIVSTANLYREGWHNRVQGLWISEKLPALPEGSNGDSVTEFRADLLKYLTAYNLPQLQPHMARIRKTDFSSVNVFFVSSVPGNHENNRNIEYGHPRVGNLLNAHSAPINDKIPVIAQVSTLGNYGGQPYFYLTTELVHSFRKNSSPTAVRKVPPIKVIYPSSKNVRESYDGLMGADCLVYFENTHNTQKWLNQYLHQWRSVSRDRNRAIPHIKTYCRYDDRGLYWFLLTSANLSRSALGSLNRAKTSLKINSYEAGVLFCPRIIIKKDQFPMNENQCDGDKLFKLPYDIPLTPYGELDTPFTVEQMQSLFMQQLFGV
jgi:tyrosyl-DNA phosphodiesterase-1